jgi:hypothetical protein
MLEMVAQVRDARKQLGRTRPVQYVLFHDRCNYDADLLRAFNQMLDDPTFVEKEMFSTLAPLSWEHCIPLQAADLIAYETFKDSEGKITGRPRRKSFDFILEMERFGGRAKVFDVASIQLLREAVDKIRGNSPLDPRNVY